MAKQTEHYKKGRKVGVTWAPNYLAGGPYCTNAQQRAGRKQWRNGFLAGLDVNSAFTASAVANMLAQHPSYLL